MLKWASILWLVIIAVLCMYTDTGLTSLTDVQRLILYLSGFLRSMPINYCRGK